MRKYQVQGNLFVEESRLCEFLIILPLPKKIEKQIAVFKEEFEVLYGSYNSRHTIPHITVCDFMLFEHKTLDTMMFFKQRLQSLYPFLLRIDGFDSFKSNRTIALNVEEAQEYADLLTHVNITRQMLRLRKNYFQNNRPNIPIAKGLSPQIFEEAKQVFSKRTFTAEFEIKRMDILKFDFITRQYQLFGSIPFSGRG